LLSLISRRILKRLKSEGVMRVPHVVVVKASSGSSAPRWCNRLGLALVGALVCVVAPRAAQAHIKMTMPAGWVVTDMDGDPQKITPCGVDSTVTYTATNAITTVHGGDKVTLNWIETIPHDGHFRIALAINSRSELTDPAVTQMNSDGTAEMVAISSSYPVLADDLFEHTAASVSPGKTYSYTVTIPNTPCAKCTLQLLQFMANHPLDPSYFYHQCADFTILAAGTGGGGGGSSTTGSGGSSAGAAGTGTGGQGGSGAGGSGGSGAGGSGGSNVSGSGGSGAGGSGGSSATGSGGSSATASGGSAAGAAGSATGGTAGESVTSSGCGCETGGAGAGLGGFGFLCLGLIVARRCRRARR
jgi:hypothetical protein